MVNVLFCLYCFLGSFYFIVNGIKVLLSMRVVKTVDKNQLNNIFNNFMRGN